MGRAGEIRSVMAARHRCTPLVAALLVLSAAATPPHAGAFAGHDHRSDAVASPLAQDETPSPDRDSGIWDVPLGDFLIGLFLAALIGAAGGFVYAGIMGPRRRGDEP